MRRGGGGAQHSLHPLRDGDLRQDGHQGASDSADAAAGLGRLRPGFRSSAVARALFPRLGGAAPVHCVAASDTGRPDPALSLAACAARRRAGGLLRVRRRRRLPPLFEPELLRFRQQLPYRRPLGCKLPVMGTRAAGGYVGMSEGWLGTVCPLFLRSFNAATTLLKL